MPDRPMNPRAWLSCNRVALRCWVVSCCGALLGSSRTLSGTSLPSLDSREIWTSPDTSKRPAIASDSAVGVVAMLGVG